MQHRTLYVLLLAALVLAALSSVSVAATFQSPVETPVGTPGVELPEHTLVPPDSGSTIEAPPPNAPTTDPNETRRDTPSNASLGVDVAEIGASKSVPTDNAEILAAFSNITTLPQTGLR